MENTTTNVMNNPVIDIYKSDIEKITILVCGSNFIGIVYGEGIKDITEIDNLVSLSELRLLKNLISYLSSLISLKDLEELVLNNGSINSKISLQPLAALKS